ncbi:hypothetical protein [Burkholderia glumae]
MLTLSVKSDVRALAKKLDALARKQLPFATAQALNATAEQVRDAQRENMRQVLDNPTPFTLNSVAIKRASKSNPVRVSQTSGTSFALSGTGTDVVQFLCTGN